MSIPGQAPRQAAVQLLNAVTGEGAMLSDLLPKALDRLPADERARAARLALTCLRWMDRADRILGPYLQKRPPESVLNALRLGTVELCVDGAASHGVVNAMVGLVKADRATERMAGLVNAVLRKVAADGPQKWAALPVPQLPKWLRKQLVADFGKATVLEIEKAHAAGPALDVTVNGDAADWAGKLGGQVLPTGSVRLPGQVQITTLPGFAEGAWWVQDAAAALPAKVLAAEPGERVLDLCAAPGGKTMQLAAAGADVTALDISGPRMQRVSENLARTGLSAKIVVTDALHYEDAPFDAILLDAPCSATGTIRRHPDLVYAKDGSDFPALFALQEAMIDKALALLKPGGRLVYSTCSLLIDEGEEQVRDALVRHPDLTVDLKALAVPGVDPAWISDTGLRTRPDYFADLGGIDGFFITMFRKP
ncbi:MAG: RsmB/NOP family class I SAM-dependent RNA methyltransferase [Paracoccaceae bacterium]